MANPSGWLRGKPFDTVFILGTTTLALTLNGLVRGCPWLFPVVFLGDLWLLGYHHVIAMFTRLVMDQDSYRRHFRLIWFLPVLVGAGIATVLWAGGVRGLTTAYFYFQWFHYTRQSYGIARAYERQAEPARPPEQLTAWTIYSLPLCGMLYRSYQAPDRFLGLSVAWLPVSQSVVVASGLLALVLHLAWLGRRIPELRRNPASRGHTLYVLSHVLIFMTAYLLTPDVSQGWLTVNIWHNSQYILFVWLQNIRRFRTGADPAHSFLSTLCQPRNLGRYLVFCLALATALYLPLHDLFSPIALASVSVPFLLTQGINFHHYVVDAVIWRSPRGRTARPALEAT